MISDEPDEDADSLDDNKLLLSYLDGGALKPEAAAASASSDWPPPRMRELGLNVDAETLKWFETNYGDWRQGMCSVLRAWVAARTRNEAAPKNPMAPLSQTASAHQTTPASDTSNEARIS